MRVDDSIRELILARAPALEIKRRALELGMTTLRQSGVKVVENGQTSIEEVLNHA